MWVCVWVGRGVWEEIELKVAEKLVVGEVRGDRG